MKKKSIEIKEEVEKFHIPQIAYGSNGLIRKKSGFQKSDVCSPFHGTHVVDRNHFVDNSGTIDVGTGYDFVRDAGQKRVSDEELEKKYGTKYYEFTILNSENMEEIYEGSDYSSKEENKKVEQEKIKEFNFIQSTDDLFEEIEEEKPVVVEEKPKVDYEQPNAEFVLNIDVDTDSPSYEYNSFDDNLEKPYQTNIPSFLKQEKEEPQETTPKVEEELSFGNTPSFKAPEIQFDNPPVDRNQTVGEAIDKMQAQMEMSNKETEEDKYGDYFIPYEQFFKKSTSSVEEHPLWLEEKKEVINASLESYHIDGEVITYTKGPAFTRYEILLNPGVSVKKVSQLQDDLQKDLQAKSLRIQSPIPGKNTVGVEVPNDVPEVVSFGDIVTQEFLDNPKPLSIALGKNIDGTPVYQSITDMPHALIAGATQSGKSVCINTILISLLLKNSPENLKLILVDPKKVELSFYNDLPHLITPVIDDPLIALEALKWCVTEMDRRYDVLARNKVRKIEDYNQKKKSTPGMENMPYIVVIVDEFNDLMMQGGQEVSDCIIRLTQKARACGIHIIMATQRPTVDVVSGTIKTNIPCRIAFRVVSDVDSRTILDEIGAESLLGRGDMLIKNDGTPIRAQGAYISDAEIGSICDYLCNKYGTDFLFTHEDLRKSINRQQAGLTAGGRSVEVAESEEVLYNVALFCINQGNCSINSIQKAFSFGFNRSQRIVQLLEEREIVSPKSESSKSREILVDTYKLREIFGVDEE